VGQRSDDSEEVDDVHRHARIRHDLRQLRQDVRQEALHRVRKFKGGKRQRLETRLDRRWLAAQSSDQHLHQDVLPRRLEALAIADEDGQGMVSQTLGISRPQSWWPVHDTRRQLALGDFVAQRDQQLCDRRA
jgi:hypothetical protein